MPTLFKASIAAAIIAMGFTLPTSMPAAAQHTPNPACAIDANFHPDEVFFVKRCTKFNHDGTCARYRVITCNGGRAEKRR